MQYFPLYIDLNELTVLVVGAGSVAARKVQLLMKTKASIVVVSPSAGEEITLWHSEGKITWLRHEYQPALLDQKSLVYCATDDTELNSSIAKDCEKLGIFVNVVDSPAECRFITPAIIDRDPITVSIASGGQAPVLVRNLRQDLESRLSDSLGKLARFSGTKRDEIKAKYNDGMTRRQFWEHFFDKVDDSQDLERQWPRLLDSFQTSSASEIMTLDCRALTPDNITIGTLRKLQQCELVVLDTDVDDLVLELVRRDADRISATSNQCDALISQSIEHGKRIALLWTNKNVEQQLRSQHAANVASYAQLTRC